MPSPARWSIRMRFLPIILLFLTAKSARADDAEKTAFFEAKVRPLLVAK